jgi:hypothetical protein
VAKKATKPVPHNHMEQTQHLIAARKGILTFAYTVIGFRTCSSSFQYVQHTFFVKVPELFQAKMYRLLVTLFYAYMLSTGAALGAARPSSAARPSTSSFRPSSTPSTFKPSSTPSVSRPALPSSLGAFAYKRPGYRPTSLVVPFAVGALAGTAAGSLLLRNPSAYCNGRDIVCYKDECERAKGYCSAASAAPVLNLVPCPSPQFGECWETPNATFVCYGARRPQYDSDVVAYCNEPEGASNAAGSIRQQKGGMVSSF